ncbi:hypothetical protein [Helicobacter sp. L8]|uniref:hypothetical protein n=1 Tax=Helicobacter sp. L8 TaxID=2316078 RepID=UPI000EB13148|nr:hypothetical protein [Helicobacter sp. L8]
MIDNNKGKNSNIVEQIVKFLKDNGIDLASLQEMLKADSFLQAWNYTELKQDKYSFKELLSWVKEHFNPSLHSAASLTKEEKAGVGIILSCCFMDKKNEAMAEAKDPFLRVIAKEIDEDLKKNFGNKDMIVLK